MDKPMTAAEVRRRRVEHERALADKLNAQTAAAFASATRRLLRATKRRQLREALSGTWEQRWGYCWARQMIVSETDLRTYGVVRCSPQQSASRLMHQYQRLTRLAERWAQPKGVIQ